MYNLSTDTSDIFRVPDYRGEFLRGAGTNSHANQGNGGSIGEHQDATQHIYLRWRTSSIYMNSTINDTTPSNVDKAIQGNNLTKLNGSQSSAESISIPKYYTARPTNTSVNWIIKY